MSFNSSAIAIFRMRSCLNLQMLPSPNHCGLSQQNQETCSKWTIWVASFWPPSLFGFQPFGQNKQTFTDFRNFRILISISCSFIVILLNLYHHIQKVNPWDQNNQKTQFLFILHWIHNSIQHITSKLVVSDRIIQIEETFCQLFYHPFKVHRQITSP